MRRISFWYLIFPLLLASCAGYEPIPWYEAPGRAGAVQALGERLAAGLADGVKKADIKLSRIRARQVRGKEEEEGVFRVVVAGCPEARTGVRTSFSRQVEEAVRRALSRSKQFQIVDGGEGIAWQEAKISPPPLLDQQGGDGFDDSVLAAPIADWREEIARARLEEREKEPTTVELSAELDSDHPFQGLWPRVRSGTYGEESAVYATSIFGADAAVFGAYALGPGRVRVWAAVVLNTAPRTIYYSRGLKDVFGLPERVERGRIYPAYARDTLPRAAVPDEALAAWLAPRPRLVPKHPSFWGEPALEVVLEEIDTRGERKGLSVRNMVDAKSLVVGRLAARAHLHVYGFALDKDGEAEEIFASLDPRRPGWSRRVEPGRFVPFTARLIETGRIYRLYFVSAPEPFEGERVVRTARRRLGLGGEGALPARSAREEGWDNQVFWLFRQGPR